MSVVSEPADRRAARILKALLGEAAGGARVTPLSSGMTNRNFRVELAGRILVLRLGGEGTDLLGIDRLNEHAASVAVAGLEVGPEVLAFVPEEGALLTRFLPGRCLTAEEARKPEVLERIVDAIHRYHQGPAFPGRFSPFDTVRRYHKLARERGVKFPARLAKALRAMDRIEKALGPLRRRRPCHNDLLPANFIDQGDSVKVLDWEYAGMGDPYFDLGNLAANQELTPELCELAVRRYNGKLRRKDLAHLQLQRLASDLRESLWGFLQLGVSHIEFDYRAYAMKHLERFLAGAAARDFSRWLKQVAAR
jgi:thiamine kinase-like enzyme